MFFKRVIVSMLCIMFVLFLFIFLVRLGNYKIGFLGMEDLFTYFEYVDFSKPLDNFKDSFDNLVNSWRTVFDDIGISFSVSGSSGGGRGYSYSFWESVGRWFSQFGSGLVDLIKALYTTMFFPIQFLLNVLIFVFEYFKIFFDFINWIISFDGYPPISYT